MSNEPLPVTVLTGFLGAGKTSLLRRLLDEPHGQRIGLIVNELGQAGIDVDTPQEARLLELTEGCVCCLRNPELLSALTEMHARGDLDRVILETTGLADPLALTWTIARQELTEKAHLDAVVTLVDCTSFAKSRSEEWEAQVRCADLVILSKLDLATEEQVQAARDAVRELNAAARILEGDERLPLAVLLDAPERPRGAPVEPAAGHSSFGVVSIAGRDAFALEPLEDLLESLPEAWFRVKGIVRIEDGRWVAFHVVAGRVHLTLGVAPPAHGECRIAVFGRTLDEAATRARFVSCRAST